MRTVPTVVTLALACQASAFAQAPTTPPQPPANAQQAPAGAQDTSRHQIPLGMLGMRLGMPRSTFPDSSCARNDAGEEWCSPRPYQHLLIRDSVVVALEAPVNFQAPDSLSADTVWNRFVLPRALRFFGPPDSSRTADGRTTLWWNWDGMHGPRRSRLVGGAEPDSGATKIATMFHIECAPGAAITACTTWELR
jgi:hypothetical protein